MRVSVLAGVLSARSFGGGDETIANKSDHHGQELIDLSWPSQTQSGELRKGRMIENGEISERRRKIWILP
jgi:hypothetical protein